MRAGLFALLVPLAGCSKPAPVVVLDSAWSVDSARTACAEADDWRRENAGLIERYGCERFVSCRPMTAIADACARDPVLQVGEFEAALAAQFAAAAECASIELVKLASPQEEDTAAARAVKRPHWRLSLDFSPGAREQPWTMTNSADRISFAEGEGDPRDIALETCAAIRRADGI